MNKIIGTTITLVRGDTFKANVSIKKQDGTDYDPVDGDLLRFALKRAPTSKDLLILKDIPIDTRLLELEPSDTKDLPFGNYVYDIELDKANGDIDTIIPCSKFIIADEVY